MDDARRSFDHPTFRRNQRRANPLRQDRIVNRIRQLVRLGHDVRHRQLDVDTQCLKAHTLIGPFSDDAVNIKAVELQFHARRTEPYLFPDR